MVILHKDNNSNYSTLMTQPQYIQVTTLPTASVDNLGKVLQYIGADTSTLEHCHFYECVFNSPNYEWQKVDVSDNEIIQYAVVPVASANNVGRIIQYVGTTTSNYIKGYFYQCVEDSSTNSSTYSWAQTDVQPGADGVLTMSKADFDTAKTAGTLPHNRTIIIPDDNGDVTNQIWIGTTAEHTAAETADTLPYNAIIGITENDGSGIKWYSRDDEGTEELFGSGGSATRELKEITTANDFRIASGAYSFVTASAVTITLADASTITIPANTIGFFDISETDETLNDYTGIIQYKANDRDKIIYFNSTSFTLPSTDNVEIDDTTASTTSTYSSSKIETVIGSSRASQMTGATSYQDGKAGLATQPKAGDNQKFLCGDGRYHTIYAANTGSTIVVVTDEPTLYGRPVTLTAGSTTLNGTFSSTGECTFNNLALYGAVQIASEDINGNPARGSTNITYFGTYVVGIGFNFATIKFTSTDISLVGESVAIYLGNNLVAETSLSLINGHLEAICYVEQLGTYRAIAKTTEGTARASVTVTSLKQTFTSELIIADIYGFIIDQNDSNPATCVKPYDLNDYDVINRNYTPAHMDFTNDSFDYGSWSALATCDRDSVFFAPKPCMLNYDGTVAYYLDPNDYTMKIDGTASDVADMTYDGNVMVEFPTIWFKRWTNNKKIYCLISNKQLDSDFHAWAHHDISGNVLDYIYISAFFGSVDNSKMRSIAGVQPSSALTRNYEVSYAINNNVAGNQAEGWYILHKSEYTMIIDLLILIGMNTNSQAVYGDGSQTVQLNGSLNNSGIFYGDNQGNCATKVFGIEGLWGCLGMSVSGWISGVPQKAKMTYGQEDNTTNTGFNFDGTGYKEISNASMASGDSQFIKEMEYNEYGYFPILGGGSSSTYYCDAISYSSGGAYPIVGWGGNSGLFAGYFKEGSSVSYGMFATRLTYKSIASP